MTRQKTATVAPILALLLGGTAQAAPIEKATEPTAPANGLPCSPAGPALEPAYQVPEGLRLVVETLQARFSCEPAAQGYWRMTVTRAGSVVSVTTLPVYSDLRGSERGTSAGLMTGRWQLDAEEATGDGYWQVAMSEAGSAHDVAAVAVRADLIHTEHATYAGLATGPWVLEAGERLYIQAGCAGDGGSGDTQLFARGYLQSADGSTTAP